MSHLERAKQSEARRRGARGALDTDAAEARYRALARWVFHLARLGPDADTGECAQRLDELTALTDDLGPVRADVIRHEEARRWWTETGCCPWCGEQGTYHDPGRHAS